MPEIAEKAENAERGEGRREQGTPLAAGPDRLSSGDSGDRDEDGQGRALGGAAGAGGPGEQPPPVEKREERGRAERDSERLGVKQAERYRAREEAVEHDGAVGDPPVAHTG